MINLYKKIVSVLPNLKSNRFDNLKVQTWNLLKQVLILTLDLRVKYFNLKRIIVNFFRNEKVVFICAILITLFINLLIYKFTCGNFLISDDSLINMASTVGGIIGASLAILFSISTFILQNSSEIFSSKYISSYSNNKFEKIIFIILSLFSLSCFIVGFFEKRINDQGIFFCIIFTVLALSFFLIYKLYNNLRSRMNPDTTIYKIRDTAIDNLKKCHKAFDKSIKFNNFLKKYDENENKFIMDVFYQNYPQWSNFPMNQIMGLKEISFRLLDKKEIASANKAIFACFEILSQFITQRNGNFIISSADMFGLASVVNDNSFTAKVLEQINFFAIKSIDENHIQNLEQVHVIYLQLIKQFINIKYSHNNLFKDNPLLTLVLGYYKIIFEKIIKDGSVDIVWDSKRYFIAIQDNILKSNFDVTESKNLDFITDKLFDFFYKEDTKSGIASYSVEIFKITLNRYFNSFDVRNRYQFFYSDTNKILTKMLSLILLLKNPELSIGEVMIDFRSRQFLLLNKIAKTEEEKKKEELETSFLDMLCYHSDFLLDFVKINGILKNTFAVQITLSITDNFNTLKYFATKNSYKYFETFNKQIEICRYSFLKIDNLDSYYSNEFEIILSILLQNIKPSKVEVRSTENKTNLLIVDTYILLIKKLAEIVDIGYGYNFPRSISYLLYLKLFIIKNNVVALDILNVFKVLSDSYLIKNNQMKEEFKKILLQEILEIGNKIKKRDQVSFGIKIATNNLFTDSEIDNVCESFKKII